jgi:uncharacterized protein (TIGR03086 family)
MEDIRLLASILAKNSALIRSVRADEWHAPTPCEGFDVAQLVKHATGWLQELAAGAQGRPFTGDPEAYDGSDPVADFDEAAAQVIRGWQRFGIDRPVTFDSMELPGSVVLAITVLEYVTHGGDLTLALAREMPFTEEELVLALTRAHERLLPEYRGEGQRFGPEVPVPDHAPTFHRLMGFMGRAVPPWSDTDRAT